MLFEFLGTAWSHLSSVEVILWMLLGGVIGAVLGILPGVGSTVGIALLLPVAVIQDPFVGLAFLLSLAAVGSLTSDYTSILFGIPGDATSAALIMDGYPMAKRGEAGRALGASTVASALGAVVGAVALAVSIPVIRPLTLLFGTPEIFALIVVGVSLVGALGAKSVARGFITAFFGFALSLVGLDARTGAERFMFGQVALFEGLPLIPLTVGLFAIPEIIDMAKGSTNPLISRHAAQWQGVKRGAWEALVRWPLILRSSFIATVIGVIPGLGGGVSQWLAYAHGMQTSKEPQNFGKGAIDGIIAPGSANNAKDAAQMIPLVSFGIPGGSTSAVLLGAMLIMGFRPGPDLVGARADVTLFIVLALALSVLIFAAACIPIFGPLARLATLPTVVSIPLIAGLVSVSAFSGRGLLIDGIVALTVGLLGWVFREYGWSRPALLLGFVLGPRAESSLWLSWSLFGLEWLRRPSVIALLVFALVIGFTSVRRSLNSEPSAQGRNFDAPNVAVETSSPGESDRGDDGSGDISTETAVRLEVPRRLSTVAAEGLLTLSIIAAAVGIVFGSRRFSLPAAIFPRFIAVTIALFAIPFAVQLVREAAAIRRIEGQGGMFRVGELTSNGFRGIVVSGWLVASIAVIPWFGVPLAIAISTLVFIGFWQRPFRATRALAFALGYGVAVHLVFVTLLSVRLPRGSISGF